MTTKETILLICFSLILTSCGGTLKKSYKITDFDKEHILQLKVPDSYSVTASVVIIEGKFKGQISVSASEEPFLYYTEDDLPIRLSGDFYGGTAGFVIFPSDAKGEITVTIEVPYCRL